MTNKIKETDKEVLERVMKEPTFKKVREAMIKENAKRKPTLRELTEKKR